LAVPNNLALRVAFAYNNFAENHSQGVLLREIKSPDDQSQQLLRASLPVGGRSITLYEEVHPDSKLGNRRVQHQFLAHLQKLLPQHVIPIIVADSGFRTPFFREVGRLGWHWLGRIRNRDFISLSSTPCEWFSAKLLYAKATRKAKLLGTANWVRSNPLLGELVTFYRPAKGRKHFTTQKKTAKSKQSRQQAKREKEPWLLVVSPSLQAYSAVRVVNYYRARMQIEEGFRDTKSFHYGLGLARESRIEAERRANLLLIAALIIFALWLVGLSIKGSAIERQIRVNSSSKYSPYSVIFLGKIACCYASFEMPDDYLDLAQTLLTGYFVTALFLVWLVGDFVWILLFSFAENQGNGALAKWLKILTVFSYLSRKNSMLLCII
jgi:hypothetical protein